MQLKAEFTIGQFLSLVLGVVITVLIILFMYRLISPVFDEGAETAESYFGNFLEEIEVANSGGTGEFSFWQPSEDYEYFLVYFGEKVVVDGNSRFIHLGNHENLICVCYSHGGDESKCENCEELKMPVIFDGMNERWVADKNIVLEITKGSGSYRAVTKNE